MRRRLIVAVLLAASVTTLAGAQTVDLTRATLEELMNVRITTAGRREQPAADAAAAVFVITRDDIRRSGLTALPELLRLAPGVQVARINANKWAVSIRGYNGLYSNKLLVLIDGRSLYTRLFSGVLWDVEDLVLEDIDRIEIVRGPGAVVWGVNAVNGVINIVTRNAADTRAGVVDVAVGTFDRGQVAARYGGTVGPAAYRVYSRWLMQDQSQFPDGQGADDAWQRLTTGFRTDWTSANKAFVLEGALTRAEARALWIVEPTATATPRTMNPGSTMTDGFLLGRWTRRWDGGASFQMQSFFEAAHRDEPIGDFRRRVADLDVQYYVGGPRHDVVVGGGYRLNYERFVGLAAYRLAPPSASETLANVFFQDQIAFAGDRLHATLGARLERTGLAGVSLQPTARLLWNLPRRQRLWTALSHADRAPSLEDRGLQADVARNTADSPLPVRAALSGNPALRNEVFSDLEAGYRADFASTVTFAVAGFAGHYSRLLTSEPAAPALMFGEAGPYLSIPVTFANLGGADTRGLEIDAQWIPARWLRVDGTFSGFHLTPRPDGLSRDPAAPSDDGAAPGRQWQLHSAVTLGRGANLDVRLFHVGQLRTLNVAAYTRADARVELPLSGAVTLAFVGQNLLTPRHAEFNDTAAVLAATQVPRSARAQITWRF
jgi:iron complex outermembrane receptor protein